MIDELNGLANKYGGLLGLLGTIFGVVGVFYGFYARNNPKPSKHKLLFKTFAPDHIPERMVSAMRNKRRTKTFKSYVDIWNAGSEPVTGGVIRQPVSVGVQEREGQALVGAEIVSESHPGVSQIKAVVTGNVAQLDWAHLDPGMCARVELLTTLPTAGDHIAIFGSGLRLEIVRARAFDDPTTVVGVVIRGALWGFGVLAFVSATGVCLEWLASNELPKGIWMALSIPVTIAAFIFVSLAVGAGLGLRAAMGWVLNAKSPIERHNGTPPGYALMRDLVGAERLERMQMEADDASVRIKALRERDGKTEGP